MTNVFYKGFEAVAVADVPSDFSKVIIQLKEDLSLDRNQGSKIGQQLYVNKSELEPCIYERFVVGAHVFNKNGSMIGKITAFEYHHNKAVVMSDKIARYQQKGTRYVYDVYDLEECGAEPVKFKTGHWYKINNKYRLMAVQSVFNTDDVMLFNNNGDIVWKGIPKKTDIEELSNMFGIDAVKHISRIE